MTTDWDALARALEESAGPRLDPATLREAGGGCVNQTWRARAVDGSPLFLKRHRREYHRMFAAEDASPSQLRVAPTRRRRGRWSR